MIEARPIPRAPKPETLQEFYGRFSTAEQIEHVANDTNSAAILPTSEIQTLRNAQAGRRKVGQGIVHIEESFILYARSCLARMGLRIWGPNLEEPSDSLLNTACRLSAITTFRQIAACGAYNFMNVNLKSLNNIELLGRCYNHFVHHLMMERFKKEEKEAGTYQREEEKKAIQKGRERVSEAIVKINVPVLAFSLCIPLILASRGTVQVCR